MICQLLQSRFVYPRSHQHAVELVDEPCFVLARARQFQPRDDAPERTAAVARGLLEEIRDAVYAVPHHEDFRFQIYDFRFQMQTVACAAQVFDVDDIKLRIANCELRVASCGL